MAQLGPVTLAIREKDEDELLVDVRYEITFDSYDQKSNQTYVEVCKLVGVDVGVDPIEAGPDDTLGFLTPLFFRNTASNGKKKLSRRWSKPFRKRDLDEDRAQIPDPDEFKAIVTLTPIAPSVASAQSNVVTREIK